MTATHVQNHVQDLGFSQRGSYKSRSSGVWGAVGNRCFGGPCCLQLQVEVTVDGIGTGCIVLNSLSRPVRSGHRSLCWLMTRFISYQWDICWWVALLPPPWQENIMMNFTISRSNSSTTNGMVNKSRQNSQTLTLTLVAFRPTLSADPWGQGIEPCVGSWPIYLASVRHLLVSRTVTTSLTGQHNDELQNK